MDSRSVLDDISTFFGGAADALASLPLSVAIATKNPTAVAKLLEAGARVQFSHIEKVSKFDYLHYTNGKYDSVKAPVIANHILKLLVDNAKVSNTKGRELLDAAITNNACIGIEYLIKTGIVPTRVQYETYKKIIDDKREENAKSPFVGFMYAHPEIKMMKKAIEKAERSEVLKNLSFFGQAHRQGIAGLDSYAFPTDICLKIANMTGDLEDPVTEEESEKYFSKKF